MNSISILVEGYQINILPNHKLNQFKFTKFAFPSKSVCIANWIFMVDFTAVLILL